MGRGTLPGYRILQKNVMVMGDADVLTNLSRISELQYFDGNDVWAEGMYQGIINALNLFLRYAVREPGIPVCSLAVKLGILIPSVRNSVTRRRSITEARACGLLETQESYRSIFGFSASPLILAWGANRIDKSDRTNYRNTEFDRWRFWRAYCNGIP